MFEPTIADHILFALFGILFPLNAVFRSQPLLKSIDDWDTDMKLAFYRANGLMLWVMAFVVILVWYLHGRPLADLGFRWPLAGSGEESILIAAMFLLAYSLDAWREVHTPQARERTRLHWLKHTPFLPENERELQGFTGLAFSAAVGEEVLFRGYFITYILSLTGDGLNGQIVALLVPTLIFALAHYYQGWKAIAKIAVLSLAFGLLFLVSGSLLMPILLHLLVDLVGGWLGYLVLRNS